MRRIHLAPCEKWDGEKWIPWHYAQELPEVSVNPDNDAASENPDKGEQS